MQSSRLPLRTSRNSRSDSATRRRRLFLEQLENRSLLAAIGNGLSAAPDYYTLDEDTTLNVSAPGVLSNDDGPVAVLLSNPANGSLTFNGDGSFSYTPFADWSGTDAFTYTPNANYYGSDWFSYVITDSANQPDDAQVTINVASVNDLPIAADLGFATNEDQQLIVYSSMGTGLLYGASDPDGDNLTPQLVLGASHGYVDFSYFGSFIYTPAAEFSGTDSFTYQISDGNGAYSNVATVTLSVDPVNDAPVAVEDSFTLAEDDYTFSGNLLGNDSDIDSPSFSPTLASGVSHGNLIVQMDGTFVYNPYANFFGSDSFSYYLSDGQASSNTVTVWLTVTEVNDAPIGVADSYTTNEDTGLWMSGSSGCLGNDNDV
jgi:VCBS repeat-containing protein